MVMTIFPLSFHLTFPGKLFKGSPVAAAVVVAPALYVFGDSLFDSGNNNVLPTFAKANYLPYGIDFKQGVTGRFTNARTVADFIAEHLGLPYPLPYYKSKRPESATLTGLNYASGSCGILPETGHKYGKCLNFRKQIDLFNSTKEKELKRLFNKEEDKLSEYLSKSIFIISIGNNDYINNYLETTPHEETKEDPQTFAQGLVDKLADQLQILYELGARKVLMFELGPIGCLPSITRKKDQSNESSQCVEKINEMIKDFNQRLGIMLQNLTSTLQPSNFILGHVHSLGYDAIQNPFKYGLKDTSNPCCETWKNGTSGCIPFKKPCEDRSSHYFWDAFHLTESVCSTIASRCFHDSSVCSPFIKYLVQL
ncbi:GDSL esterase/lipase 7-like [Humulus lupulus]|uniref:GDSL esterase/lipase 7-like n=1 Tax=Humulus lupulus TaxID=3486 RepID=UPI002B40D117|nr:GDSL esterase/lipase 7-like [Humulus lupulus]